MRNLTVLIFLFLLAAACGKPLGGPLPVGDYKLYEATSPQQLAVLDSRSHALERTLPLGALFASSHLYAIQDTSLLDIDPQSGATQGMLELPGRYQLPPATINGLPGGLSQNGWWLVVQSNDGATTRMVVIDTVKLKVKYRVNLAGDFQFDAISNDGLRLYLIEYLNKTEYYVRLYNLPAASLDANIVFDKSDGKQSMVGQRLMGVPSPDGHWLYSMYVREHEGPFVHALSMDGPFAFCIDLTGDGYVKSPAEYAWSLAMTRDGSRLIAANGMLGLVAQIEPADNYHPSVKKVANYDVPKNLVAKQFGAVAITPDHRSLVVTGHKGIVWLDADTLRVRDRALTDWTVRSLALSDDGAAVYAVNDAGMIAELSTAPRHSLTTFGGAPGQPIALIRVDGGAS